MLRPKEDGHESLETCVETDKIRSYDSFEDEKKESQSSQSTRENGSMESSNFSEESTPQKIDENRTNDFTEKLIKINHEQELNGLISKNQ